ncbi:MAG: amidohydrolase [Anaerolineae bacterium]|nr:amidohydrolase [Anaerolineae bacterium]MDW8098759.1 amidohydrolase [Anaerolineae bacterium]
MSPCQADLILFNGRVYTMDPALPFATAVATLGDRILAVGSDSEILHLRYQHTQLLNVRGEAVFPGFIDAHIHFAWWALHQQQVDLSDASSPEQAMARVAEQAAQIPPGTWILGGGFDRNAWPGAAWPTRQMLDAIAPQHPVMLHSHDHHSIWVNTLALRLAGVTAETPDPPGGRIVRDPITGEPTGILSESAVQLVQRAVPSPTLSEMIAAIREAQPLAWAAGLTSIHEIHDTDDMMAFRAFQELRRAGELGLRVCQHVPASRLETFVQAGVQSGFGDEWIRIGGVKFFMDGALGSRTADMLEPYIGEPDNRGVPVMDKKEMLEQALQASRAGLSVSVHAIGDRANRNILDVLEAVRRDEEINSRRRLRHRIEHVQVLHPADLPRLAQLDVIASMQPVHATSDMLAAERFWGPERCRLAYAWRSLLDTGARLAFGSDAPVEPFDVLAGIYAAVTRRRPDGTPGPNGWQPQERITVIEAVRAYTLGAAYASGEEAIKGTLTPGKLADMVVLSRDITACPAEEILSTRIEVTILGGQVVYRAPGNEAET